jgi:5-methylcytosine-specific restriction endonuclease McrA
MSFVVDHVMPLAKGGADTLDNKKAAHRECNSKKRARIVAPIVRRSGTLD